MIADLLGNSYIAGGDSRGKPVHIPDNMSPGSKIYLAGNVARLGSGREVDQRALVDHPGPYLVERRNLPSGPAAEDADAASRRVLRGAGAVAPRRDAVDRRIVRSVRDRDGRIIDWVGQTPGYPTYAPGEAPRDSDGDGMADDWEARHRLDPNDPGDGMEDRDRDGYSNVEEYINSLVSDPAF